MGRVRVFISIDDLRGVRAIEYLVNKIDYNRKIDVTVKSLMPCSNKMTRILKAASIEYDYVIVLTDAETDNPDKKKHEIIVKHKLISENIKVIPIKPCIESWPCGVLGLKNCERPPCREGPIGSLNTYMRTRHRKGYEKKYLRLLFEEVFNSCRCEELLDNNVIPGSLRMFIYHILEIAGYK